jgi:adenosylcobinamide kinase/adenosylcobinamide-phosphate guanylyltransferase
MIKKGIVFITGGIKSGKTSFSYEILKNYKKVYYIATSKPKDKEMKNKIKLHKFERPKNFWTMEEQCNLKEKILKLQNNIPLVIDCINFWLFNVMEIWSEEKILKYIKDLCKYLNENTLCVIISNEVGLSLVSEYKSGRKFQNLLGKINQIIAKNSKKTYFLLCGIPLELKNKKWR